MELTFFSQKRKKKRQSEYKYVDWKNIARPKEQLAKQTNKAILERKKTENSLCEYISIYDTELY